jgi:hypothetical protein
LRARASGLRSRIARILVVVGAVALPHAAASAQPPPTPPSIQDQAIRVFIECKDFFCDNEYIRTEITFVNHMRDRQTADVHVLGTGQPTGSGGTELTLQFIGQGRFGGRTDILRYRVEPNQTDDAIRVGLVRMIKIGLMRFVAETPLINDFTISYAPKTGAAARPAATSVHDRWNFWVMRIRFNGGSDGEETSKGSRANVSFSGDRVTEDWKINLNTFFNYDQRRYAFEDGSTFRTVRRSMAGSALVVKSLSSHWSLGGRGFVSSSTYANQDIAFRVMPGIEYNIFPYAESTRRQLTIQYNLGVTRVRYDHPTVFDKTSETLTDQSVLVSLDVKQRWGTAEMAFETSHFLSDPAKNHLTLFGFTDLKLFRGFSVNMFSSIERIHDQVYLAAGEATTEEVLVRQRQLLTGYRYEIGFGISYTFGSIFNNVVNPRFRSGPGGIIFF